MAQPSSVSQGHLDEENKRDRTRLTEDCSCENTRVKPHLKQQMNKGQERGRGSLKHYLRFSA